MGSYYAKIAQGFEFGRLVAVTGELHGGLLRVIDVDIQGTPIGSATYISGHLPRVDMKIGPDGYLTEDNDVDDEIDWAAHENTQEEFDSDEDNTPVNPMLKGFM